MRAFRRAMWRIPVRSRKFTTPTTHLFGYLRSLGFHRVERMRRRLRVQGLSSHEIQSVAEEAYIYGYPLVLMDVMRRMHTAVSVPTAEGAPINQFAHARFLPDSHSKHGLRPHADSVCSSAWLDLSRQPMILTIPS